MNLVNAIQGRKIYCNQDDAGRIISGAGVLYTNNLFNCIAVVIVRADRIGMIHMSPGTEPEKAVWTGGLFAAFAGDWPNTTIIVAGGNGGHGTTGNLTAGLILAAGATIIDATGTRFLNTLGAGAITQSPYTGRMAGFIAASAQTDEYMLSDMIPRGFEDDGDDDDAVPGCCVLQ